MKLFAYLLPALLLCASAAAQAQTPAQRAQDATAVLAKFMQSPDKALPQNMLNNAYAVAIIPDVIKAGLVVGGRHGLGLVSIKQGNTWSDPSFISLTGGSIGFQIGVSSTDVVLIFRSKQGVDSIVYGKFTLGTDLAVAAGPVGRSVQAATDAQLKAQIYSYSRTRGLFAGVALQGAVMRIDDAANAAAYGKAITAAQIFAGDASQVSKPIADFNAALEEYTTP
ncbi:MAG: lipid-binding SYLF domain-containing protein [Xanthomonadales bacterium]|nr:lipid-binding SYLF domain-containing protein [Xanthomonadales bacterium]